MTTKRIGISGICLLSLVLACSPTRANWIDTFDGGLDQTWYFGNSPASSTFSASTVGNVLRIEDPAPVFSGGSAFGFGYVNETFSNVRVSGIVNPGDLTNVNSDHTLIARANPSVLSAYALTLDYRNDATGDLQGTVILSRIDPSAVTNDLVIESIGESDSFYLEFDVFGSTLTGRVYDQPGGTLLKTVSASDSAFANGVSGVAASADFFDEPLLAEFDNVASSVISAAHFDVTIQPSADSNDIVWTVKWDSLNGIPADDFGSYAWDAMDPMTGDVVATAPWGSAVKELYFDDIGDPFGAAYSFGTSRGFGDAIGGVSSDPSGWGVGPDYDGGVSNNDDLFIFNTLLDSTASFPTSGEFVLTVSGANLSNYNLGTYTNNPFVTVTVTDTLYIAPVPEPSTFALLGLGSLALVVYGWRRKQHDSTCVGKSLS
ncbi:PEP-CTERM motif protein [Symmachiella macrocystis]|uniref:PEP-CTERM motif protein n=1 Tax=Symmachiella macrocystis TaxID=2527985 RepID=A0A5C6AYU7_9PLAN|nr:PEP-CTERM sorting domain-containing protein [Symmachiella macrocystis]TWU05153.1 PEP-CTERM motif protein [Symmachiella macrocystis]